MRVIYRDDGSAAWGTITAILMALVLTLGVGFFVYAQSQPTPVVERGSTTIIQPGPPLVQPVSTMIPIPVPGPSGAPGPAGRSGTPGSTGPAGAPGAPGSPGNPGSSGPQGPEGAPAPAPPTEPTEAAPRTQ